MTDVISSILALLTNQSNFFYKQLILPIIKYPSIRTHDLSKSRLETLQKIQNKALKQAYYDTSYPPRFSTEELHRKGKLNAIN